MSADRFSPDESTKCTRIEMSICLWFAPYWLSPTSFARDSTNAICPAGLTAPPINSHSYPSASTNETDWPRSRATSVRRSSSGGLPADERMGQPNLCGLALPWLKSRSVSSKAHPSPRTAAFRRQMYAQILTGRPVEDYKSSGVKPVCFATRASIRGPISSSSRKANT